MTKKFFQTIFSIKNEKNHKVLTFMGLKVKLKKRINLDNLDEILNSLSEKISSDIAYKDWWDRTSIYNSLEKEAHQETLQFIKTHIDLNKVILLKDRWQNLLYCIDKAKKIPGLYIECGVHSGRSINHAARHNRNITFHGFDSFEGLPEEWSGNSMQTGAFDLGGCLPEVEKNVRLYKGWFNESLTKFFKEQDEKIAFLHVDCDIYQSTVDIFNIVEQYLQKGTIIVFDEYFNYPNWQNHEFKAFNEFITRTNFKFEYISIGHLQVGIRILEVGSK